MKSFKLRDKHGFPCTTVVTVLENDLLSDEVGYVSYLIFTHNPVDRYDKQYAARIAPELISRGAFDGSVPFEPGKVKESVVRAIIEDEYVPHRSREAAKLWFREQEEIQALEEELNSFETFLSTKPSHAEVRRYLDFGEHLPNCDEPKCAHCESEPFEDLAEVGFDFGPQEGVVSLQSLVNNLMDIVDRVAYPYTVISSSREGDSLFGKGET